MHSPSQAAVGKTPESAMLGCKLSAKAPVRKSWTPGQWCPEVELLQSDQLDSENSDVIRELPACGFGSLAVCP